MLLFQSATALADDAPSLADDADIYLVPIGPVPAPVLQSLAHHYRQLANFKVEVTAGLPLTDQTVDLTRKQIIAERVHGLMAELFQSYIRNPLALVIGISAYDMYIEGEDWRYAYAYGQGRYALVSAARMDDGLSTQQKWSDKTMERLRKMLDKRIAIQYFGMDKAMPVPMVLAIPILGPDDLDHLNAAALESILARASTLSMPRHASPAQPPAHITSDTNWTLIGLGGVIVVALFVVLYRFGRRSESARLQEWRTFALKHGWKLVEGEPRWYSAAPITVEGELAGIPFTLSWYQEGSGKGARFKTRFVCDFVSNYALSISPMTSLLAGLISRGRVKTHDPGYDCRFIVNSNRKDLVLPTELKRQHLSIPCQVLITGTQIQLIRQHAGETDLNKEQALLDLAQQWIAALRDGQLHSTGNPHIDPSQFGAWNCRLGRAAELVFWLFFVGSVYLLWWIRAEETNIPWSLGWKYLAPIALAGWAAWLTWRWNRHRLRQNLLSDTLISAMAVFFLWIFSGPWIMAWNVLVGPQTDAFLVGSVAKMRESQGKGGPSYFVTMHIIGEERAVQVRTDHATYAGLRVGDPAGFRFRKGSLGIYYNLSW